LAIYSPELFVHNYLNTFALYLLSALSLKNNQTERSVAFISLGEIAIAVGGSILSLLLVNPYCVTIPYNFIEYFNT